MLHDAPDLAGGSARHRFRLGLGYPLKGVRLVLGTPSLWPLVVAPVLVNLALLAGAVLLASWAVPWVLSWLWVPGPETAWPLVALWKLGQWSVVGLVFLFTAVLLYFTAGLIATPFLDRLSEKIETMVLGPYAEPFSWRVLLGDLAQSVLHTVLGLLLWAVVMVALFGLNVVPGIGSLLEVVLSVMASALFVTRETMDGAMSRRRMGFAHKLAVLRRHLALTQGFGVVAAAMLWVPFLNFLVLPMAVAGGTLLFCHLELQGLVPDARGEGPLISARRRRNRPDDVPTEEVPDVPRDAAADARAP